MADKETFNWFKGIVSLHYSLAKKLHKFRNYQKALDLVEEVSNIEIDILKHFGLPGTFEFTNIIDLFSWKEDIDEFDIIELYKTLHEAAENYLLSPALGDKRILIEAKEKHLTANDFFATIGIQSNLYNVFLYETMFYRNDIEVHVILSEIKKGNSITPEIIVKMDAAVTNGKVNDVNGLGLQYWNEFTEQRKTERQKPSKKEIQTVDIARIRRSDIFPETFSFDEGYIDSIEYFEVDNPYMCVKLITSLDLNMLPIMVYMPINETFTMLKQATNHFIASDVRSMLYESLKENKEYTNHIQIRDWHKTYLYFKGFEMTVTKCEIAINGIHEEEHNIYKLNTLNDNYPLN